MGVKELTTDQDNMGFQSSNEGGNTPPEGVTYATGGSKSGQNDKGAVPNVGPAGDNPSAGGEHPNGSGGSTAAKSGNDIPARMGGQSSNKTGSGDVSTGNRMDSFANATRNDL